VSNSRLILLTNNSTRVLSSRREADDLPALRPEVPFHDLDVWALSQRRGVGNLQLSDVRETDREAAESDKAQEEALLLTELLSQGQSVLKPCWVGPVGESHRR